MRENKLIGFGHFKRRNNEDIVKLIGEIIVSGNWGREGQRKNEQGLLKSI